jgi:hypothetical protein
MQKQFFLLLTLPAVIAFTSCGKNSSENRNQEHWATSRIFQENGTTFSPADLQNMELRWDFEPNSGLARGEVHIRLKATANGITYFLSEADPEEVTLDGETVEIESRLDPDRLNLLRTVRNSLEEGREYSLRFTYRISPSRLTLSPQGVSLLTSMGDVRSGNFLEAYAPAGFEGDSFALSLGISLHGDHLDQHSLFANGEVTKLDDKRWQIEFPEYFGASSFYLHLTHRPLTVRTTVYQGRQGAIPILVYSQDAALASAAIQELPTLFSELEETYGPYAHASFLAYITAGRGGMEHAGATVTSLGALAHEVTHSWFARGVMPSDGRSGWIDEAVASWRDYGYRRAEALHRRAPTNLGRFSPFQRFTPGNCYVDGRALLSELDLMLADRGGLRPLLRDFYSLWKRRAIRTADFQDFLETRGKLDVKALFRNYVYGSDGDYPGDRGAGIAQDETGSLHPPALTPEEVAALR